jgi:hypothetical protein
MNQQAKLAAKPFAKLWEDISMLAGNMEFSWDDETMKH